MQQPQASQLHEFQFFGQGDDHHESVAWLFDNPPPAVGDDDGNQQQPHQRPSTFDPFGKQYQPGNGLTFEVSLGRGEVDARLGLGGGGGARNTETAASAATIVSSSGSKDSQQLLLLLLVFLFASS
jgi:hypothetical protein